MSAFDETQFDVKLDLRALRIPREFCAVVTHKLNGYLLDKARVKPFVGEESFGFTIRKDLSAIPGNIVDEVRRFCPIEVIPHSMKLGYSYWGAGECLAAIAIACVVSY